MYKHLLSAIEADINQLSAALTDQNLPREQAIVMNEKKIKLTDLAINYVQLENRYREISGIN